VTIPEKMQGRNILASDYQKRKFVLSARDRCDETVEHMRAVRTQRFKYIRNYLPKRPYLQPNRYKDTKPIIQAMRRLYSEGKLNQAQSKIMAKFRPEEELYDLQQDPFELNNLVKNPNFRKTLLEMRLTLETWILETDDKGRFPEPTSMYDSDMFVYTHGNKEPEQKEILKRNIALMKKWAAEGK
jgi:hypothetical protein